MIVISVSESPPFSLSLSLFFILILAVLYRLFHKLYRRVYEEQGGKDTAVYFVEGEVRQEMSKSAGFLVARQREERKRRPSFC